MISKISIAKLYKYVIIENHIAGTCYIRIYYINKHYKGIRTENKLYLSILKRL